MRNHPVIARRGKAPTWQSPGKKVITDRSPLGGKRRGICSFLVPNKKGTKEVGTGEALSCLLISAPRATLRVVALRNAPAGAAAQKAALPYEPLPARIAGTAVPRICPEIGFPGITMAGADALPALPGKGASIGCARCSEDGWAKIGHIFAGSIKTASLPVQEGGFSRGGGFVKSPLFMELQIKWH